jgi:hypothetical protein
MTSAEQVRSVLDDYRDLDVEDLVVEDQADGSAIVCHTALPEIDQAGYQQSFPVTEELHRCADVLSDAGFVVALVKGERGVYLNAQ